MRSVVDITFGKAHRIDGGVTIPIGMHISDDEWDDNDIPIVTFHSVGVVISEETISGGRANIREGVIDSMSQFRVGYSASAWEKLIHSVDEYLAKNDLTSLGVIWIPEPDSRTKH